jgi:hypothetical protein
MRFIFLVEYTVGRRDYDRFGVDLLRAEGFDVEIWDFMPFLNSRVYAARKIPDPIDYAGTRTFSSEREALKAIAAVGKDAVFFIILAFAPKHRRIYRALSKSEALVGLEQTIALPATAVASKRDVFERLKRLAAEPRRIAHHIFLRVPPRFFGISSPDFVVAGGRRSIGRVFPIDSRTEILRCHTLDYDLYLREQQQPLPSRGDYAVFLDEYWPFHPDFLQEGVPNPVAADVYYPALNRVFEKIERDLGWRVIIAAHPRSRYESSNYFGDRPVIKGETINLVRGSKLVIGHDSTSLNFAIMYRKPVLFLSVPIDPVLEGLVIVDTMARAFGKHPVPLFGPLEIDWESELAIDEAAYNAYRDDYIKVATSPDVPTWKLVADYVKSRLA